MEGKGIRSQKTLIFMRRHQWYIELPSASCVYCHTILSSPLQATDEPTVYENEGESLMSSSVLQSLDNHPDRL